MTKYASRTFARITRRKIGSYRLEPALKDFPTDKINEKPEGSPHTAWQLLEHIRIAQWDILDFSRNANYKEMKWPDDYWPKKEARRTSGTTRSDKPERTARNARSRLRMKALISLQRSRGAAAKRSSERRCSSPITTHITSGRWY